MNTIKMLSKDNIVELLHSTDKEVRELGISYLENNFDVNFFLYELSWIQFTKCEIEYINHIVTRIFEYNGIE